MARRRRIGGRRSYGRRARRFARNHVTHLAEAGGLALAGYGVLGPPQSGWSWNVADLVGMGGASASEGVYNMIQSIPIYGKDSNMAGARSMVGAGLGLAIGAKVARSLFPSLNKISFKIGSRRKLAIL